MISFVCVCGTTLSVLAYEILIGFVAVSVPAVITTSAHWITEDMIR